MPKKTSGKHRPGYKSPNREKTKMISGHFEPSISAAMRAVAYEEGKSLQQIMSEAFADYLEKYRNRPPQLEPGRPTKPPKGKKDQSPDC